MKNRRTIILLAACAAMFLGCTRIELGTRGIVGTWAESYDSKDFSMDGAAVYTFSPDGTYNIRTYDLLTGESGTLDGTYTIDHLLITINRSGTQDTSTRYRIVKLRSNEMSWQKDGTEYSPGMLGYDYLHFVRAER